MIKHPSFEFDRRRFLGLAACGVAASATGPLAAFAQAAGAAQLEDRHHRRRP